MKSNLIISLLIFSILMNACGYSFETDQTLEAYLDVVARMERSNYAIHEANNSRVLLMEDLLRRKPDYKLLSEAARDIIEVAKEFTTDIDNVNREFYQYIQIGDGMFINYFQTLDKSTLRNKQLVNDFFVNGYKDMNGNWNAPEGVNINAKISETNHRFINILNELRENRIFGIRESEKREVISKFLLGTPENHALQNNVKKDIFTNKSVAATYANMTMLKNDALLTAQMLVNYLGGKISGQHPIFDRFMVVSSPRKIYIKKGETFKADIFLSAASSQSEFTAKINGKTYPVDKGVILYEIKPDRYGTHTYEAEISLKHPDTKRIETFTKTFKYEVGECYH